MEERWVYMDGEFVKKEEARISVFDHGFLYGDGIFEGIRVYNGNIFRLREHLVRLYESAKSILLEIPHTLEEMEKLVVEAVRKNKLRDAYIRLVVSRGVGDLGLDPTKCHKPSVVIIVDQVTLYAKELYENGLEIVTVPTRRNVPDALNPKIKSLNYLNNVLVKIEANRAGVGEALMVNADGYVGGMFRGQHFYSQARRRLHTSHLLRGFGRYYAPGDHRYCDRVRLYGERRAVYPP